jgi:RNA polymerase sigma factor (sigma-70 family)
MNVNRGELYRFLSRRYSAASPDDVDEAIQHAVTVTYEMSVLREAPNNAQAYVTTVATRALARTVSRTRSMVHPDRDDEYGWIPYEHVSSPLVVMPTHDDTVDASTVLSGLPERDAALLRRHYLEGIPFEVIAQELELTPECVRKRHERALKRARSLFVSPHRAEEP